MNLPRYIGSFSFRFFTQLLCFFAISGAELTARAAVNAQEFRIEARLVEVALNGESSLELLRLLGIEQGSIRMLPATAEADGKRFGEAADPFQRVLQWVIGESELRSVMRMIGRAPQARAPRTLELAARVPMEISFDNVQNEPKETNVLHVERLVLQGEAFQLAGGIKLNRIVGYDTSPPRIFDDSPAAPSRVAALTALHFPAAHPEVTQLAPVSRSIVEVKPKWIFRRTDLPFTATLSRSQTLVLGGWERDRRSFRATVPILGDLPLAGRLFRQPNLEPRKTQFIFISVIADKP
jgi:Bacterial type II and III secretion system protein